MKKPLLFAFFLTEVIVIPYHSQGVWTIANLLSWLHMSIKAKERQITALFKKAIVQALMYHCNNANINIPFCSA